MQKNHNIVPGVLDFPPRDMQEYEKHRTVTLAV